MKRAFVVLLCFALTAGIFSGCGNNKEEVPASTETQGDAGDETEDPEQESEEQETEKTAENDEAESTQNTEEDSDQEQEEDEEEIAQDLTMVTLRDNAGTIDYTSLEGLDLEPGTHIAVVVKTTKSSFWQTVKKGMDQAIEDLNNKFEYKDDEKIKLSFEGPAEDTDVENQINRIDAVLDENPSVLCLAAIDMESCQTQLETAADNGIPVIVLDSGVVTGDVNAVCATDNQAAGAKAAQMLAEAIGGEGEIAIMTHIETSETSRDRQKGFEDEIAANYPDIEIVNISHENEENSMEDMAKSVLTLFSDLKGYYATNETSATAVLSAVEGSGKDIAVVGFDTGKKQIEAIKKGTEIGVISQNPYGMGYATIIAAARAESGLENDAFINSGYQWIDAASLEDEIYKNYLYE